MVKIRVTRLDELVKSGNRRAKIAQSMLKNLNAYLSATQLGITLASLGLGWIGEPTIARVLEGPLSRAGFGDFVETISYTISFLFVTVLHIVLGELTPKSLAIQRSEGTVLMTAPALVLFYKVMYPLIRVLNGAANLMLKMLGIGLADEEEQVHTEEEIRILMSQSHRSGLIDNTEMALFDNIFEFSNRIAREIMVPRIDMIVMPWDATHEQVMQIVEEHQHTRYPIMRTDKDNILGYIHVKDLYVQQHKGLLKIGSALRSVIRVPETAEISDILRRMQKYRTQIAIVVDEFGGTAGLLTMEDIIEELVGEIQDEFDDELPPIVETENGYSVDGRLLLHDVSELLQTELEDMDVDTVGGWMMSSLSKTAVAGDLVQKQGYTFEVQEAANGRVERVLITKSPK